MDVRSECASWGWPGGLLSGATPQNESSDVQCGIHPPIDQAKHQIRLLEILPGNPYEPFECSLRTVTLRRRFQPAYIALSYVWGDPTITENIVVNGHDYPVTVNLAGALKDFREHGIPRETHKDIASSYDRSAVWRVDENAYKRDSVEESTAMFIWVDAVCINQADTSERNHQIGLMREIYSNAALVVACIMDQAPLVTQSALLAIASMAHDFDKVYRSSGAGDIELVDELEWDDFTACLERQDPEEPQTQSHHQQSTTGLIRSLDNHNHRPRLSNRRHGLDLHVTFNEAMVHNKTASVRRFLNQDYFQRMWICQETAFAGSLIFVCGNVHCTIKELEYMVTWADLADRALEQEKAEAAAKDSIQGLASINRDSFMRRRYRDDLHISKVSEMVALRARIQGRKRCHKVGDDTAPLWSAICTREAGDSRDYVYALLSMMPLADFVPDYRKTKAQVYLDWARYLDGVSRAYEMLDYSGIGFDPPPDPSLPSWLPDLPYLYQQSATSRQAMLRWGIQDGDQTNRAEGHISDDGRVLQFSAVKVAEVTRIGFSHPNRHPICNVRSKKMEDLTAFVMENLDFLKKRKWRAFRQMVKLIFRGGMLAGDLMRLILDSDKDKDHCAPQRYSYDHIQDTVTGSRGPSRTGGDLAWTTGRSARFGVSRPDGDEPLLSFAFECLQEFSGTIFFDEGRGTIGVGPLNLMVGDVVFSGIEGDYFMTTHLFRRALTDDTWRNVGGCRMASMGRRRATECWTLNVV